MPPTATGPVVFQAPAGTLPALSCTTGHPGSVYVPQFQYVNSCIPAHQGTPVQLPDGGGGWMSFLPLCPPHHGTALMVPLLQQGPPPPAIGGPTPARVSVSQGPVMSCSPPANQFFNPLTNSTNMEVVWHGIFNLLFSRYPDMWTLIPASTMPNDANYKVFQDSAKVRFLCQTCGKAWTSMKGRVIFVAHLDRSTNRGFVFFKLFGQQCQKCTPGSFEHAMWYPEEVNKVVANVFHSVGKAYYGMPEIPVFRERRRGKPRTQHNSSLCQACADNICLEGNFERAAA